jgi:asparagine synthase (glutamine-hydrolysing)
MCGITGIIADNPAAVDKSALAAMTGSLRHRGPDDEGMYFSAQDGALCAGLGHRRLSIIDLSAAGHQPMSNEDGTVWITFNGEIYNFQTLKQELAEKGHRFRSGTDTEVIVHGYEQHGERFFERLNGMFAFGLWDERRHSLHLARDRYGQKPLYYWETPGGIVFASEMKAILKYPLFKPEMDPAGLFRYLAYEYLPASHTIFKGVKKLLPGHCLSYTGSGSVLKQYWQMQFKGDAPSSMSVACEELVERFRASVRRHLVSDVPLGVFLSGGIDSSCVVALMCDIVDPKRIKTFSIGFEEPSFDESTHSRTVAKFFGTDHHERIFTAAEMLDVIPEVCGLLDEPFADPSVLPTYLLSKFTRQHVTVALSGDGGDELFAGYDPFIACKLARYYDLLPAWFTRRIARPLAGLLPVSESNMSLDFRVKQFLRGVLYDPAVRNQVWLSAFSQEEINAVLSSGLRPVAAERDVYDDIRGALSGRKFRDVTEQMIFLYSRFYLAEDILTKVDRASMAVSLEVRPPFLDAEFSDFVNGLPSGLKLPGLKRKFILKKAMAPRLPASIRGRGKKGFGIPLTQWLKGPLHPLVRDMLSEDRLRGQGLFDPAAVRRILDDHFSGKADNRKKIWTLLVFELWKERYCS